MRVPSGREIAMIESVSRWSTDFDG